MCALFSLEILQAGAVKGLKNRLTAIVAVVAFTQFTG